MRRANDQRATAGACGAVHDLFICEFYRFSISVLSLVPESLSKVD